MHREFVEQDLGFGRENPDPFQGGPEAVPQFLPGTQLVDGALGINGLQKLAPLPIKLFLEILQASSTTDATCPEQDFPQDFLRVGNPFNMFLQR